MCGVSQIFEWSLGSTFIVSYDIGYKLSVFNSTINYELKPFVPGEAVMRIGMDALVYENRGFKGAIYSNLGRNVTVG